MKCPYSQPTIENCRSCPLADCVRTDSADYLVYINRWKAKNPEKVKEYDRKKHAKYYKANKSKEDARVTKWKSTKPKRVRAYTRKGGKKYRKTHREEERERNRLNYLKRKGEKVS